jgi:RimJ/RimL family protein N-acetyltransferase
MRKSVSQLRNRLLMAEAIELETQRLRLRQWRTDDREPFAAPNADLKVMEFFPSPLSRAQSDAMADRCQLLIEERGWGFWAVEGKETEEFIGFVGLHTPVAELPFSPCVEVGWRLAFAHWGKRFASEAAARALHFGFQTLALGEIVSFTTLQNLRSCAVMERLGMQLSGTFEHPLVAQSTGLRQHWLYRLSSSNEGSQS